MKKSLIAISFLLMLSVIAVYYIFQRDQFPLSENKLRKLAINAQENTPFTVFLPSYLPENLYVEFSQADSTLIWLSDINKSPQIGIVIHPISWKENWMNGPYGGEAWEFIDDITVNSFSGQTYTRSGKPALYIDDGNTFIIIYQPSTSTNSYSYDDLIKVAESLEKP